ncbi:MAG TPA: hypothetical protein VGM88_26415 [Kofleriaceae bacterium]|jgi:hypothetical protein
MIKRTLILLALASLAGCPDNPYKASTWTKKLKDQRDSERAVTELENLGDPSSIEPLGKAWEDSGKPVRMLQVLISIARPLTPEQAKTEYVVDYETTGRPASWDKAAPFLIEAMSGVDEANPRSVDCAQKAADAMGDAKVPDGLAALIELAGKKPSGSAKFSKKLIAANVAAIRALGKYDGQKAQAAAALQKLIEMSAPPHPKTAKNKDEGRLFEEQYGLYLGIVGASINALADLRAPSATETLVLSLFRTPELFTQSRRALVATGPSAEDALRKVLRGEDPTVEQLFKDKRLGSYCGDKGDSTDCQQVSAHDFYPAVVLGDFYDPKSVPDLLAALNKPALPVYFQDDQPSPNTQYNAIFDSLRKIGAPDGVAKVKSIWEGTPGPAAPKGAAPAPAAPDLNTRILAVGAYPFIVRDQNGVEDLGKIAADNKADDNLRQEAATAFARLAIDDKDIGILTGLAQKYFDARDKKRIEADKAKPDFDAAEKERAAQSKGVNDAKAKALRATHDNSLSPDQIRQATADAKKAEEDFKAYMTKYKASTLPYKSADGAAKAYEKYARMFESHVSRIEVAMRCKDDMKCYAAQLAVKPDDEAKNCARYIKDIADWKPDDKAMLVEGAVERAMLELGKRGPAASAYADTLLDNAKADDRIVRQSILLALPKIAKVPCANCETKLEAAIRSGEGKVGFQDLNLETTMMKNYFSWAGGKSPAAPPAEAPPAEAPAK